MGIGVEARGRGQGSSAIWYDCSVMRATLQIEENIVELAFTRALLGVDESQDTIVRDTHYGRTHILLPARKNDDNNEFHFRFGDINLFIPRFSEYAIRFTEGLHFRVHPNRDDENCLGYCTRLKCPPYIQKLLVLSQLFHLLSHTAVHLAEITITLDTFCDHSYVTLDNVRRLTIIR